MDMHQTLGARILNALHDRLDDPEPACCIVRKAISKTGADDPDLVDDILDRLHMSLPFPTHACAVVGSVRPPPLTAAA